MTPTDYRDALAKLLQGIEDDVIECNDGKRFQALVEDARALLAAPEAVGVADDEPVAWGNFREDGVCVGLSQYPEDIARWLNPRPLYLAHPAPVPVGERLPRVGDCAPWSDGKRGEPWCWFGKLIHDDEDVYFQWVQCWPKYGIEYGYTHWLPHWALPLPEVQ